MFFHNTTNEKVLCLQGPMLIISEWPMRAQDMFWVANQVAGSEGECKSSVIRFGFRGSNQTSQLPNTGLQTTYTLREPSPPATKTHTTQTPAMHNTIQTTNTNNHIHMKTSRLWNCCIFQGFQIGGRKGVLGENIREKKDFAKCAF